MEVNKTIRFILDPLSELDEYPLVWFWSNMDNISKKGVDLMKEAHRLVLSGVLDVEFIKDNTQKEPLKVSRESIDTIIFDSNNWKSIEPVAYFLVVNGNYDESDINEFLSKGRIKIKAD